jgi:hypothetical protein
VKVFQFIPLAGLALGLLMMPTILCGAPETRVFEGKADGFKITLPGDWEEIPSEVLDSFVENMAALAPNMPKQSFQYGYQRASDGKWFTYPYILVQVKTNGPVAEDEAIKFTRQPGIIENETKSLQAKTSNFVGGFRATGVTYDKQRHILRMQSRMEVADVGDVNFTMAMFLTSIGELNFNCYTKESDAELTRDIFEPAISSIQLAKNFTYRPPPSRSSRIDEILSYSLVGGCVGMVFALARRFFMGKKPRISGNI